MTELLFRLRSDLTPSYSKVGLRYLSKSVLRVSRGTDIGEDTDEYLINLLSKIEPHKTKNTAAHKTTALKRCTLQNYRFGTQEESNKILRHKKNKPHHTAYKWLYNAVCGRSGENRTPGLDIPNVAPCQLGYTPIFMKFFSKWSNMWSDGFSTKISAKQKRRDGVV